MSKLNRAQLRDQLEPLTNELSLKLVDGNLKDFDILFVGDLLKLCEPLQEHLSPVKHKLFPLLLETLNHCLGLLLVEGIDYAKGIQHVQDLHAWLTEGLEAYFAGKKSFSALMKQVNALRNELGMEGAKTENEAETKQEIEGGSTEHKASEGTSDVSPEADQCAVIQEIHEDSDTNLIGEFIGESEDGLEEAEQALMDLEQNPTEEELAASVFRIMHTLKGTAGFLGLSVINHVSHCTEDVLVYVRDTEKAFSSKACDLLLQSIDILKQLLDQLRQLLEQQPTHPINVQEILDRLQQYMDPNAKDAQPEESTAQSEESDSSGPKFLGDILVEEGKISEDQLEEALREQKRPLGEILVEKGATSEREVKRALKKQGDAEVTKVKEMIKIQADKLDELGELIGEMVVALSVLKAQVKGSEDFHTAEERFSQLEKITENLYDRILGIRMFPVGNLFSKLSRQVRDLSRKSGKQIELHLEGADTLVDKTVIDGIYAPMMHLVRNAIDHGIEAVEDRQQAGKTEEGNVSIMAQHHGDSIVISVKDDGKGLAREAILKKALDKGIAKEGEVLSDQEVFSFIFQSGFSTAQAVTDISGRGVGMDVVRRDVESLRGRITIDSTPGQGTTFFMKLPLSTSIIEGLIVRVGSNRFIFPILDVSLTTTPRRQDLQGVHGKQEEMFLLAGELVPIVRLHQLYEIESEVVDPSEAIMVVVKRGEKKYGLMVDELVHRQQIVVKSLGKDLGSLMGISGGTILGDGHVGLILAPEDLLEQAY